MGKKYGKRYSDPAEALSARSVRQGDCIVYTGARNAKGYGIIAYKGKTLRAHRVAWELEYGPLPDGVVLDHTCYNPPCINLAHLRPATRAQNQANRSSARSATGHRNVYYHTDGYMVVVEKAKVRYGRWHKQLGDAIAEASALREELFGEFAGRG